MRNLEVEALSYAVYRSWPKKWWYNKYLLCYATTFWNIYFKHQWIINMVPLAYKLFRGHIPFFFVFHLHHQAAHFMAVAGWNAITYVSGTGEEDLELRKELIPFLLDCKERAPLNYFGGSYKGSLAQKIAKNVWSWNTRILVSQRAASQVMLFWGNASLRKWLDLIVLREKLVLTLACACFSDKLVRKTVTVLPTRVKKH